LQSQRLGRLATVNAKGDLHVVPVGFRYNAEHDTIDIGGHNIVPTKKYRDALSHGRVAFVVDDALPPWRPRLIEVRGTVQAITEGERRSGKISRRTSCASPPPTLFLWAFMMMSSSLVREGSITMAAK
jgi:PPOX class F420-dependent enzyme/OxyR family protein